MFGSLLTAVIHWSMHGFPTTRWEDWEVGIELMIAALSLLVGSIFTEGPEYRTLRGWLAAVVFLLTTSAAALAVGFGYDASGHLTWKGYLALGCTGVLVLAVTFAIDGQMREVVSAWNQIYSSLSALL